MGSRTTYFSKSLKRVAALASVLGAIGGIAVTTASAQTAPYESLNHAVQQAGHGQDIIFQGGQSPSRASIAQVASRAFAPAQVKSSARIIRTQPVFSAPVRQQTTINRRALVGQGRMVSAGFRQEPGVLGSLPQTPGRATLKRKDDPQDFFGENQSVPTVPRNDIPAPTAPNAPRPNQLQDGELPPDVFRDPFQNERRPKPSDKTIEIPGEVLPGGPGERENPPKKNNGSDPSKDSETPSEGNPFVPQASQNNDNRIDYQPGRGLNITRSRSNVYRAPGSENPSARDRRSEPDTGVYFVPAYDPIPGTQQSTLAPPAAITPEYHRHQQPAWPNQYAPQPPRYEQPQQYSQQPRYEQPRYEQPRYEQPRYEQPRYEQPRYEQLQQYSQQPGYEQPLFEQPQHYAQQPSQQVYSSVVEPVASDPRTNKGPTSHVRRGLFEKIQRDLKRDLGFGDYQSCQGGGDCGGCDGDFGSSCDSKCPVFYFGFQGAWNDAFNISNDLGSELVLDDGSAFFFSLGRMNGRNLRTEIEFSFRDNEISSLITPTAELAYTGQLQTFSGMANLYWEFINFPTGRLKPYVGAGVGFLSVSSDLRPVSNPSPASDQSGSSSSFAYQLMAGVNFKVSNHLDLYGEYRFLDAESISISSDRDDLSGDFSYSANSIGGGFRWKF